MTDRVGKFPKKGEELTVAGTSADEQNLPTGYLPADEAKRRVADGPPPHPVLDYLFTPNVDEDDMAEWERVRQPFIIHPETTFNTIWDIMSMFLILYSCIMIPYRLCFGVEPEGTEKVVDGFVDTIFMIDCCLCFRKAVWGEEGLIATPPEIANNYMRGWFFLDFSSSFPFDAVLGMTGGANDPDQARILKIIRIFRMVKILRMVRIQRLLKKLQDDMGIKNGVMISVKFAMFTCFAAHFQACLWFLMSSSHPGNNWALGYCIKADAVNNDAGCGDTCGVVTCRERIFQLNETAAACPNLWASEFGPALRAGANSATCLDSAGADCFTYPETEASREYWLEGTVYRHSLPDETLKETTYYFAGDPTADPQRAICAPECDYTPPVVTACIDECSSCDTSYQYTTSFYWSIVTLTTLGYGDIGPSNHHERMFCVYAMLLGASIFAYSVTNMCTLVHNLNPAEVFNRTRLDELNDYLGFLNCATELTKKCQDFFLYKVRKSDVVVYNQDLILQDMSRTMQEDVRLQALGEMLRKIPIFADQEASFLAAIAVRMDADPLCAGNVLFKEGQILTKMYVIGRGTVALTKDGQEDVIMGEGGICGMGALFRPSKSAFTATTQEYIDLFALAKYHFDEVLGLCGLERDSFEQAAVQSGLLEEAEPAGPPPSPKARASAMPAERLKKQIEMQAKYIVMLTNSGATD